MASTLTYLLSGTVTEIKDDSPQPYPFAVGDPFSLVLTVSQSPAGAASPGVGYANVIQAMTAYIGTATVDVSVTSGFPGIGNAYGIMIADNEPTETPGQFEDSYVLSAPPANPDSLRFSYGALVELSEIDASPQAISSTNYIPFPSNWPQFPVKRMSLFVAGARVITINGEFTSVVPLPGPVTPDWTTLTIAQALAGDALVTGNGAWTFGAAGNAYGNTVLLNGGATAGYATLLEVAGGGHLYAQASDGSWWRWNNPGWSNSIPPTGSADASTLTLAQSQAGSSLVTRAGKWTFGAGSTAAGNDVLLNGGATGGNATLLEVSNGGQLYARASDLSWRQWGNPGWLSSAAPTGSSADGSTLTLAQSQAGGSIVSGGDTFTFGSASNDSGNAVLLNQFGNAALFGGVTVTYATLLEVANGGQQYAQERDGSWWLWHYLGGWSASVSPNAVSPDGTTMRVPTSLQAGSSLVTSAGRWTFGAGSNAYGNDVLLDGGATGGDATLLEVANGGQLYAQAGDLSWWRWGTTGWAASAAPTASLNGTTLTVGQVPGELITNAGTWTFDQFSVNPYGHAVLLNGGATAGYATLLEVAGGQLYAEAGDGSWWLWNNPGWSSSSVPMP